jgi:hypothetical protein
MNNFTVISDYDKTFYMRPIGSHNTASAAKTTQSAGNSYFSYMGKSPKHISSCNLLLGISPITNMSSSYGEVAICTGKFNFNSSTSLKMISYVDITEYYNSYNTGNKIIYIPIPLSRNILPKEDIWVGIGCGVNFDVFSMGTSATDEILTGVWQSYAGRISTNMKDTFVNTTLSANGTPWILIV